MAEKNVKDATEALNKIQQEQKDAENKIYVKGNAAKENIMREAYQNSLRDLDARIALEIRSENTSSKTLEELYNQTDKLMNYSSCITIKSFNEIYIDPTYKTLIVLDIDDTIITMKNLNKECWFNNN